MGSAQKAQIGQKLHHGMLHQVVFIMSLWIIINYPYPQNSKILEVLNVKSACNGLVYGDDTFYFYYFCVIFNV